MPLRLAYHEPVQATLLHHVGTGYAVIQVTLPQGTAVTGIALGSYIAAGGYHTELARFVAEAVPPGSAVRLVALGQDDPRTGLPIFDILDGRGVSHSERVLAAGWAIPDPALADALMDDGQHSRALEQAVVQRLGLWADPAAAQQAAQWLSPPHRAFLDLPRKPSSDLQTVAWLLLVGLLLAGALRIWWAQSQVPLGVERGFWRSCASGLWWLTGLPSLGTWRRRTATP
jgi:hypothetical protein